MDTYRIVVNRETERVDFVLPLGTVAMSYPIVDSDEGIKFIPLSALLLIEGLKEQDMELECIVYPQQTLN